MPQAYLAALPPAERRALETLRAQLRHLMPDAEERLSRGVPFFHLKGKRVVGYRASKGHLSFFIMEGRVLRDAPAYLAGFDHGPTVVRFTTERPLPPDLVERLVRARLEELAGR